VIATRRSANWSIVVVLLLLALGIASCGGDDDDDSSSGNGGASTSASSSEETLKVALATVGPRNDNSFSEAHFNALQQAKDELPNIEVTATVDNLASPEEQRDALTNLARTNDLVVAGDAAFVPLVDEVASQFPDTQFTVSTGLVETAHDNVTSIIPEYGGPAAVIGAVAATLTKTNKLGYLGGAEIPVTTQTGAGFEAGAKRVNPDVQVDSVIVGDFNDVAKAEQAAKAHTANGADQLFGFLDAGIRGLYHAAEEKGNVGTYQIIALRCDEDPSVMGSMVLDVQALIFDVVKDFSEGNLKGGAVFYGMKNPDILRADVCPRAESPEIDKVVKETTEAVLSGDFKLPADALYPRPDYPVVEK
jgi:basic membrane protein A